MLIKVDSLILTIIIYLLHEKEKFKVNFGENLKKMRKSKKMSQEDLAEKINVSRQSISKWETGISHIK